MIGSFLSKEFKPGAKSPFHASVQYGVADIPPTFGKTLVSLANALLLCVCIGGGGDFCCTLYN